MRARLRGLVGSALVVLLGYLLVTMLFPPSASKVISDQAKVNRILTRLRTPSTAVAGATSAAAPGAASAAAPRQAQRRPASRTPAEANAHPPRAIRKQASGRDDPNARAPVTRVTFTRGADVAIGRLTIPKVGLRTGFRSGVYDEALRKGPGHWPGTVLPGTRGNAVLSGHRTTYTHPFRDLNRLRRGDRIITRLRGQEAVVFRVRRRLIVEEDEYVDAILHRLPGPAQRRITLFACHPKGWRTHRIVVRATADSGATADSAPRARNRPRQQQQRAQQRRDQQRDVRERRPTKLRPNDHRPSRNTPTEVRL